LADDHHDHSGHNHDRAHRAAHVHAPANFGQAFGYGIALNLAYLLVEAGFGIATNSLALISDAAHNLGDVLALGTAWGAAVLAGRRPTARYTYGLRRTSILAALVNAAALLIVTGGIAWEAILRFWAPAPPHAMTIIVVAAAGIIINGGTALLFVSGRKSDLNLRGVFQHMLADALVAFGVVAAGVIIMLTRWHWLDPAASLAVSAIIVAGTWSLLREALSLSLDAVPQGIERENVNLYLTGLPGVLEVHDLHIWGLSTTETALTAHLICRPGVTSESLLPQISAEVRRRFGIGHATIQLETEELARQCELRPDHVV
jgi:cobalt-zinc-cadmium efflux system protein